MRCLNIESIVDELERNFGTQMDFAIEPFNTDDAKARIQRYDVKVHGIVITKPSSDELVWKESGHDQTYAGVAKELEKLVTAGG